MNDANNKLRFLLGREPLMSESEWMAEVLASVREEGRLAGLEEASRRVRAMTPIHSAPRVLANVADVIDGLKGPSLSNFRVTVEQPDCWLCTGCVRCQP